jgi:hypothetical protein
MLTRLFAYVKGLVRRNAIDAEVSEELRFHVEMETQANVERGMTPTEARQAALRELGGVTQQAMQTADVLGHGAAPGDRQGDEQRVQPSIVESFADVAAGCEQHSCL